MVSVKSSTECTRKLEGSEGVIYVYCGPCTDKDKVMKIGQEIITKLNYVHPSGEIFYGMTLPNQKIDIMYRLQVPVAISQDAMLFTPIKSLNSFMKDWCLKARVTVKIPLRVTANGKSLLKIELLDQEGS